jgi:hypothetical protein
MPKTDRQPTYVKVLGDQIVTTHRLISDLNDIGSRLDHLFRTFEEEFPLPIADSILHSTAHLWRLERRLQDLVEGDTDG